MNSDTTTMQLDHISAPLKLLHAFDQMVCLSVDHSLTRDTMNCVLTLKADCMPTPAIKQAVVDGLVLNINTHDNHTTSGIIGWRFVPEALSANGHGALFPTELYTRGGSCRVEVHEFAPPVEALVSM
jgi:hypothetical protein